MAHTDGNDCYSAGERGWMEYGQQVRGWWLAPSLRWLTRMRITPDMLTLLSGLCGIAFAPLWVLNQPWPALALLALHVLLDGLDGPLARHQNTASPRGSFTDTFTDQIVVTAVTVAWMVKHATAWTISLGATYIFLYTLVVAMAMVRNAMAVPYSWLVRPRFFVFTALIFESLGLPIVTLVTMFVCCGLLAMKAASGFVMVRK